MEGSADEEPEVSRRKRKKSKQKKTAYHRADDTFFSANPEARWYFRDMVEGEDFRFMQAEGYDQFRRDADNYLAHDSTPPTAKVQVLVLRVRGKTMVRYPVVWVGQDEVMAVFEGGLTSTSAQAYAEDLRLRYYTFVTKREAEPSEACAVCEEEFITGQLIATSMVRKKVRLICRGCACEADNLYGFSVWFGDDHGDHPFDAERTYEAVDFLRKLQADGILPEGVVRDKELKEVIR